MSGLSRERSGRRLLLWVSAAALAAITFTSALITQSKRETARWSAFLVGTPEEGERVFRNKGCIHCHAVNGSGGTAGPDLGRAKTEQSSLPQLVTTMWNHAPRMWARMKTEGIRYPNLTYPEMAQLLTYLYMARHVDAPGDLQRGRVLFETKGCVRCHAVGGRGGMIGPELASIPASTPVQWVEAMWNHASGMNHMLRQAGLSWPQFEGHELRDLYAFTRRVRGRDDPASYTGDPQRGWALFQQKGCNSCHSIHVRESLEGPNLGPGRPLPSSFSELGGLMLSHAPQMESAMQRREIARPQFTGHEIADVFAFLYSLRYEEPEGSPHVGASVFSWRGCARCHGHNAEGTSLAPALRGRGSHYNSISLAVALWRHGQEMYQRTLQQQLGWPTLQENDIGDLLAFLNAPPPDEK